MPFYSDEKTEVKAGDICECVSPTNWTKAFRLIRRKEEVQAMTANEPLVKWPEEAKQLTWPSLEVGEWFAFDKDGHRDAACLRVEGGYCAIFDGGTSRTIIGEFQKDRIRRLKLTQQPKFEVI